jgi:hypothetical protein
MSQTQQVYKMLLRAGSRGVPNFDFPKHRILRYSARIGELRKDYDILCEREYHHGKATGVFRYILIKGDK